MMGKARLFTVLIAVCIALLPVAVGVADAGIEEVADVSTLALIRGKVTFHMPLGTAPPQDTLDAVCRRLTDAVSCIPSVVDSPAGSDVSFNVDLPHDISIISAEGDGPDRLVLLSKLRPVQFALGAGFGDMTRALSIRYPTHTTVVEEVRDTEITATIPLDISAARDLPLADPGPVSVGEVFSVPAPGGDMCIFAIIDGSSVAESRLAPGCRDAVLSTAGLNAGSSYRLLVVSVDVGGIRAATKDLFLESVDNPLSMALDRDAVVMGDPFTIELGLTAESCTVTLTDPSGVVADRLELTDCDRVPVGTSSGLAPGRYIVRVEAKTGNKISTAARTIEVRSGGMDATSMKVEKRSYLPGETASIHVDTPGDYCYTGVYNMDNIKVGEDASFGCGSYEMKLAEALPAGKYLIKTEVFDRGTLKAVASTPIEVEAWEPRMRTTQAELCTHGFIAVDDHRIQCISESDSCIPSSISAPFCVCFVEGDARSVCEYGDSCTPQGCKPPAVASPFIIVHELSGRCLARRGADTLTCLEIGEICGDECVCLSGDGSPISACTDGQACQPEGCRTANLEFKVESRSADHVRSDILRGGLTVTWEGTVDFEGRRLVTGPLSGKAFIGQLEAEAFDASFDGEKWAVKAVFKGELGPGVYELYLMTEHGGYTHVIRRAFEVWYSVDAGDLEVSIERVTPRQLSRKEMETGATVELGARIRDARGTDLVYLPQDAFSLKAGGLTADSVGVEYSPVSGIWTIVGDLYGRSTGEDSVSLTVEYLGRRGSMKSPIAVMERVPLSIRILKVDPGTRDKPLFYMLTTLGFDLDVFLHIRGADRVDKESFDIRMGGHRVKPEDISYIVSSLEGTRVHITRVRLCPPEKPNTLVPLVVGVTVGGEGAQDTTTVLIKRNPGNWDNVAEARC